jgi:hypothetical protein
MEKYKKSKENYIAILLLGSIHIQVIGNGEGVKSNEE